MLMVLPLSFDILLPSLLEITAHGLSLVRSAFVAITMAFQSASRKRGHCYRCILRFNGAQITSCLSKKALRSNMREVEGHDVERMSPAPTADVSHLYHQSLASRSTGDRMTTSIIDGGKRLRQYVSREEGMRYLLLIVDLMGCRTRKGFAIRIVSRLPIAYVYPWNTYS